MERYARMSVFVVSGIHFLIMAAEIFPWSPSEPSQPYLLQKLQKDLGFENAEQAVKASPILRNAGLFNGFLAAGLLWGAQATQSRFELRTFFLTCVIVAGAFGAITLPWKDIGGVRVPVTLFVQSLAAIIALVLCVLANRSTTEPSRLAHPL